MQRGVHLNQTGRHGRKTGTFLSAGSGASKSVTAALGWGLGRGDGVDGQGQGVVTVLDLAHNPGMCPDWESNWQPSGSQSGAQSTEPHRPQLDGIF